MIATHEPKQLGRTTIRELAHPPTARSGVTREYLAKEALRESRALGCASLGQAMSLSKIYISPTSMRISLDGASKVWIDHNHIQNIGRQFLVNGFNPSTQVSISNDYLDGRATYSTGCDGDHHGVALFSGTGDEITFARVGSAVSRLASVYHLASPGSISPITTLTRQHYGSRVGT